jgi:signal transduction histidine kinase
MEYTKPKESWSHLEKTMSRNIADLTAKVFERFSVLELVDSLEQKVERRTKELKQTLDDLKATQERMVVQEKLASLGTLTAGIAHEIKNPLGLITNASEALPHLIDSLSQLCTSDEDKFNLEQIQELTRIISTHSTRTNTIINNMLSQVSEGEEKTEDYDLSESCQQSIDLARRSLWAKYAHDIDFILDLESRVYVSHCKQDVTKIFNNLLQNSAHSIAEKASRLSHYRPQIKITLKRNGKLAEIVLHDNGQGIPQNILHKVLNPFFTTKNPEEGTGLGLSMVSDLVKSQSGFLQINSSKNDFTTVKIQLPIIES